MEFLSALEKQFIREHATDDVRGLLLRAYPPNFSIKKLAAQISARQKARTKLPNWYANDDLIFPPTLSVEQASSEQTAQYKASLTGGHLLLDLTGGMGVDTWAFAQRIDQVIYVERQPELAELAAYNLPLLGASNVTVKTGDGLTAVDSLTERADWLYLDPHRRDEQGGRVVRLADCEPDVSRPDLLNRLFLKTHRILLKTSPLIDIDATIQQLSNQENTPSMVESVHVVAVQGEVKEVLFILIRQAISSNEDLVNTVNLINKAQLKFNFKRNEERTADVTFGDPKQYVYEPNAAVLKAGAFRLVAARFGLTKLAPNSHLYTSDTLRTDFPGRTFALQHLIKPDRKALQSILPSMKANLTVRNFPQSVAELRKKLGLQEGGSVYILATTLLNGDKRLLVTKKIDSDPTPN